VESRSSGEFGFLAPARGDRFDQRCLDAERSIGLKWRADINDDILSAVLDAASSIEFDPRRA